MSDSNQDSTSNNAHCKPKSPSRTGLYWYLAIILLGLFAVTVLLLNRGYYGFTIFLIVPFCIGLTIGYFIRRHRYYAGMDSGRKGLRIYGLVILIAIFFSLMLMAFKVEGAICILMAAAIIFLPSLLGVVLGFYLYKLNLAPFLLLVFFLNISAAGVDVLNPNKIYSTVTTELMIPAGQKEVWNILTHPVDFSKSRLFFFKAGITYPTSMQLTEKNGRRFLYVTTNIRKDYLIPIDTLIPGKKLSFLPLPSTVPMKEWSFYNDKISAKHLKGYFLPLSGAFTLYPVSENQCLLKATTTYTYKITPVSYWKLWSDYLVDAMQRQVLTDIQNIVRQHE